MSASHGFLKRLHLTSHRLGIGVLALVLAFGLVAFNRDRLGVIFGSGDTVQAEFSRVYKLQPYNSVVKLSGVKVGTVTGVESAGKRAVVLMKLDKGTRDKLGTEPSALIRPALVLGGRYYVELVRGGLDESFAEDGTIPLARTDVPVELDKVLTTLTPDARRAIRGTVDELGKTLRNGGREETRRLLESAPGTLMPAGRVLESARGLNPATDLTRLVTGIEHTADALTERDGRLASMLDDLESTSATFDAERSQVGRFITQGPETLRVTEAGLADLDGTLDRLTRTAESFRPAARQLDSLLERLDPVLSDARPVVSDLRALAADARPLVERLVPTAKNANGALNDIKGPVLDRLTGPLTTAVLSPWRGSGLYEGGGNGHKLYEEAGYLLAHGADVFKFHDKNGAMGRLMAGVGLSTAGGIVPMSLEQYLETLGLQQPAGPQEGTADGAPGLIPPPEAGRDAGGPGLDVQLPLGSRSNP